MGKCSAIASSKNLRIAFINSAGYTYFNEPNFVRFLALVFSSMSRLEALYHSFKTVFDLGVNRCVISSIVNRRWRDLRAPPQPAATTAYKLSANYLRA